VLSLLGFEKLDFSLYPDHEYQLVWLRCFLESSYEERGQSALDVTDVDVERLYVQVNKFALVSPLVCDIFMNLLIFCDSLFAFMSFCCVSFFSHHELLDVVLKPL